MRHVPVHGDLLALGILAAGFASLSIPSLWSFLVGVWSGDSRGHEPLVLVTSAFLLYGERSAMRAAAAPAPGHGWVFLCIALVAYLFGRTQQWLQVELLALPACIAAVIVAMLGWRALGCAWFAFLFMMFAMPLPFTVTLALTAPLKAAVSAVAARALWAVGYPAGHTGVVITIGQYQLLVAEACAGLHSMFILESMGLLFTRLMGYRSWQRNALMAVLVVPVSFLANVIRVMCLAILTYHFGDAVGQGFLHRFAGVLLFSVAIGLLAVVDRVITACLPKRWAG